MFNATETTQIVYKCSMLQRQHNLYSTLQCYIDNTKCLYLFNATEATQIVYKCSMLHRQNKVFTNDQFYRDNKNGSMLQKKHKLFTTVQCYRNNRNCLQLFNATETPHIVYRWSFIPKQHTLFTIVQFYTETTITCKCTTDVGCAAKYYRLDTCLH